MVSSWKLRPLSMVSLSDISELGISELGPGTRSRTQGWTACLWQEMLSMYMAYKPQLMDMSSLSMVFFKGVRHASLSGTA